MKKPIDSQIAANVAHLVNKNPSYTVRCYSDEEISSYVKRVWGPEMFSVLDSINLEYIVAKTDLWRYLIIYDQGGVYLDDKSGPRIPLDRIIRDDDELILSTWNMNCHLWAESHGHKDGEFLQWCIIARPRHPLIRAVICEVVLRIITSTEEQRGKTGVITITGPLAFTDAILGSMNSKNVKYRIMQNSFRRKIFFNAITRDARLTKHHHAMRPAKRNYRSLTTPVINPEAVLRFHSELGSTSTLDFVMRIMSEFDERHHCGTQEGLL